MRAKNVLKKVLENTIDENVDDIEAADLNEFLMDDENHVKRVEDETLTVSTSLANEGEEEDVKNEETSQKEARGKPQKSFMSDSEEDDASRLFEVVPNKVPDLSTENDNEEEIDSLMQPDGLDTHEEADVIQDHSKENAKEEDDSNEDVKEDEVESLVEVPREDKVESLVQPDGLDTTEDQAMNIEDQVGPVAGEKVEQVAIAEEHVPSVDDDGDIIEISSSANRGEDIIDIIDVSDDEEEDSTEDTSIKRVADPEEDNDEARSEPPPSKKIKVDLNTEGKSPSPSSVKREPMAESNVVLIPSQTAAEQRERQPLRETPAERRERQKANCLRYKLNNKKSRVMARATKQEPGKEVADLILVGGVLHGKDQENVTEIVAHYALVETRDNVFNFPKEEPTEN